MTRPLEYLIHAPVLRVICVFIILTPAIISISYNAFPHLQLGGGRGPVQLGIQHGLVPVLHLQLHEDDARSPTRRPGAANPAQMPRPLLPHPLR